MSPYAIIGALVAAIVLVLGGVHVGKKLERESWQADKIALQQQMQEQITADFWKYERMVKFNEAKARKASEDHAKELSNQKLAHDAAVARKRADGGLRINRAACQAKDSRATVATGAGRPDGATSGPELLPGSLDRHLQAEIASIRLPVDVENDLFDLVEDAGKVATRLRNLQKWVKDNGMYGPASE